LSIVATYASRLLAARLICAYVQVTTAW
jgi:hypothetical protein